MRGPVAGAGTTSTTGSSATTSGSAPARTASSPMRAPARSTGGDGAVEPAELPFEYMLNALRLYQGVPLDAFTRRTGLPLERIAPALAQARARGWLEDVPGQLRPSLLGQRFLNDLIELFLA